MKNNVILTLVKEKYQQNLSYSLLFEKEDILIDLGYNIDKFKEQIFELIKQEVSFSDIVNHFKNTMEFYLLKTIFEISSNETKRFEILYQPTKLTILNGNEFLFETVITFETFLLLKAKQIKNIQDLSEIF